MSDNNQHVSKLARDFPQHARVADHADHGVIISDFVGWLRQEGYEICGATGQDKWVPATLSAGQWAARRYGVDLYELQQETDQMLDRNSIFND